MTEKRSTSEDPSEGDLQLADMVGLAAHILRLGYWQISISEETPESAGDEEVWASSSVSKAVNSVTLRFGPKFHAATAEEKWATVVHELIHCYTQRVMYAVEAACRHKFTDAEWAQVSDVIDIPVEIMTDELSWAIPFPGDIGEGDNDEDSNDEESIH